MWPPAPGLLGHVPDGDCRVCLPLPATPPSWPRLTSHSLNKERDVQRIKKASVSVPIFQVEGLCNQTVVFLNIQKILYNEHKYKENYFRTCLLNIFFVMELFLWARCFTHIILFIIVMIHF